MGSIKLIRAAKAGYLAVAALFCAMGVAMLTRRDLSTGFIGWGTGAILAAFGIVRIIGFFSRDPYGLAFQHDPALGMLAIALGSVLMFRRNLPVNVLGLVLGVQLVADNLFKVQTAMEARRFGLGAWWLLLALAAVTIVAGSLLIACPFQDTPALIRAMGLSLLAQDLLSVCVALCAIRVPTRQRLNAVA